jgi:phosphonate transport system substrate-binding protein
MTETTLIFETFLTPTQYKLCLYITEYVERCINVPAFLLNGESLEDFEAGYADAGFISTNSFTQLVRQKYSSAEIVALPLLRYEDMPMAFFDVVVHNESSYLALEDLRGCVWVSYVRQHQKEGCRIERPLRPAVDCIETIEVSSQAQLLRLLLDGKAHAAAIDTRIMDMIQRNSPQIAAQLRILGTYCISVEPLIAIATHVNAVLKQKIREALLTIHRHPLYAQRLREEAIERFIPVTYPHRQHVYEPACQEQTALHVAEFAARHLAVSIR